MLEDLRQAKDALKQQLAFHQEYKKASEADKIASEARAESLLADVQALRESIAGLERSLADSEEQLGKRTQELSARLSSVSAPAVARGVANDPAAHRGSQARRSGFVLLRACSLIQT